MRLAVAFNIFDGTELLDLAVKNIRPCVDTLIAVYQRTSNYGNPIDTDFPALLQAIGFHHIVEYTPALNQSPHFNECKKRNIGMDIAKQVGCDAFMTMDCDELYNLSEFKRAFSEFERSGFDATACMMQTYYHSSEWVYAEPETYYVPLFYRLDNNPARIFKEYIQWPMTCDPTRKLQSRNVLAFPRSTIQMHHYSYVRNDIRLKLINSSALRNYKQRVDEIVEAYENWDGSDIGLTVHGWTNLVKSESLNIPLPNYR
jgi:hypothetical protein